MISILTPSAIVMEELAVLTSRSMLLCLIMAFSVVAAPMLVPGI